jgi:trans-aconitate 2-methyltransferase
VSAPADAWSPGQYEKFRSERMQPFFDLAALIKPEGVRRAIDVGCGTGELTVMLAERLPEATLEGVDASASMLAQAQPRAAGRVSLRQADATALGGWEQYDLVFSHATFQWLPDNEALLDRILTALRPGAQIAVQVPTNDNHPSHRIAHEVAAEQPFATWLGGYIRRSHVLTLERYSTLLWQHGLREQVCFEKIYPHELQDTLGAAEWVKGTLLTAYLGRLDAAQQEAYLDAYRARLLQELGEQSPFYYPFLRLLFWGRKQR